jgi:molybdopterin-containing oxidoreductase family membrane subunit
VSWDFAAGIVPGWHSTISAPFFVAGAIFSGLAMVFTLMLPIRSWFHLEEYITIDRLDQLAKLTLLMGMVVTYSYLMEYFVAWYGGEPTEQINLLNKAVGAFATEFWIMTACNCIMPLILFFRGLRRNVTALFIISIFINIGMWMDRFVIVACSLARDYNPYAWTAGSYQVTLTELGITLGSFGWFMFLFLLFCKFLPVLPIAEVKRDILLEEREEHAIHEAHMHRLATGSMDPKEAAG